MTATAELVKTTPELPDAVARRNINEAQWRTLMLSLFPGARAESVLMVVDYCKARGLDPLKKPCHIVPMRVKDAKTGEYEWRDVVMPGIYEYRTTAHRTGEYLGHSRPEYGEIEDFEGVKAPAWCEMTIYRRSHAAGIDRVEFPVRVYFAEAVATNKEGKPNERWSKAPIQMLTKCVEAAGLREAFPEEFGGEPTAEELEGQHAIDLDVRVDTPKPAQRKSEQQPQTSATNGGSTAGSGGTAAATASTSGTAAAPSSPASASTTPTAVPVNAPAANVGVIVDVLERGNGALIKLNTGFQCATGDAAMMQACVRLRDNKTLVDIATRPNKNDPKKAPVIEEITPMTDGAIA